MKRMIAGATAEAFERLLIRIAYHGRKAWTRLGEDVMIGGVALPLWIIISVAVFFTALVYSSFTRSRRSPWPAAILAILVASGAGIWQENHPQLNEASTSASPTSSLPFPINPTLNPLPLPTPEATSRISADELRSVLLTGADFPTSWAATPPDPEDASSRAEEAALTRCLGNGAGSQKTLRSFEGSTFTYSGVQGKWWMSSQIDEYLSATAALIEFEIGSTEKDRTCLRRYFLASAGADQEILLQDVAVEPCDLELGTALPSNCLAVAFAVTNPTTGGAGQIGMVLLAYRIDNITAVTMLGTVGEAPAEIQEQIGYAAEQMYGRLVTLSLSSATNP